MSKSNNTKNRLKSKLKIILEKNSEVEKVAEEVHPDDYLVRDEFTKHAAKVMTDVAEFQQGIIDKIGKLTKESSTIDDENKDDLLDQLWKCRKKQFDNIRQQAMQIAHQMSYILIMTQSLEEWLADDKVGKTIVGDYDLAMINADLGQAHAILFVTEANLNHNYLSSFDGWGKRNTTLQDGRTM